MSVGGWFLPLDIKKTVQPPLWQACLPSGENGFATQDAQVLSALVAVPAGTYDLPSHTSGLFSFLNPYNMKTILIKNGFFIQERQVAYALFEEYAYYVENLPQGEEKKRRQPHLGLLWNRGAKATPATVQGISWEAAMDYRGWLRQKTGCDYNIPSREEWVAAIIHLYSTGEPVPKLGSHFGQTPLGNLLRGGQEWTRSPCAMGYYLVGEDNWVTEYGTSQAVCMPPLFSVAGFRLTLNPAKRQENPPLPSSSMEQEGGMTEPADQNRETNP